MAIKPPLPSQQLRTAGLSSLGPTFNPKLRSSLESPRSRTCLRTHVSVASQSSSTPSSTPPLRLCGSLVHTPESAEPHHSSLPFHTPTHGHNRPHRADSLVARAKPRQGSGGRPKGKASSTSPPSSSSKPQSPPSPSIVTTAKTPADALLLPLHETSSLSLPAGPPESEDVAVSQAGACLAAALSLASKAAEPMTLRQRQALGQAGRKGRGSAGPSAAARLQVEIPVRDDTPAAQVSLLQQLVPFVLPPTNPNSSAEVMQPKRLALFLSSQAAADATSAAGALALPTVSCESFNIKQAQVVPKAAELVIVVGPRLEQAPQVQAVVGSAGKRPVLLLNPGWAATGAPVGSDPAAEAVGVIHSAFDVAYCFMPLAFQGLLGSSMGALLCAGPGWDVAQGVGGARGGAGAAEGAVWVLFKQQGTESKRIAVLRRRPRSEELQNLMYANMAAESPVSKSIQFMKSLIGQAV